VSDDISIDVGLNPAQYISGAQQLIGSNAAMQASMGAVVVSSSAVQRAFHLVTPNKVMLGGLGAASAAASDFQSSLATLRGTEAVTGISSNKLGKQIHELSQNFGSLGQDQARSVTEQITQMGLSSKGSEKQIGNLATTVVQLAAATGESPTGLATGMGQFARATGNTNLDPRRFMNLADSLTQVSKASGATATDVLAFSKNIAPMASAAGIGATGILGISASFARLGEDGIGAQTAVNKMMTDMSRSVREGGPEMKIYAAMTGTTADNFKRMFENDPTATLNRVVKTIGDAGPQGPRMLEQLGLDGVRSMKAIQALSSSGGLDPAIAQAQAGYASGSTVKAAEAAQRGLNENFSELTAASQNLAQAFGAPLLAPLSAFVGMLKIPVKGMATMAGSDLGQMVMKGIGALGAGWLGLKAFNAVGQAFGFGRMAATSGTAMAARAGFADGQLRTAGLAPGPALQVQRYQAGLLTNSLTRGPELAAYQTAQGSGRAVLAQHLARSQNAAYAMNTARDASIAATGSPAAWNAQQAMPVLSRWGQVKAGLREVGTTVGAAHSTMMTDTGKMMRNAALPFQERDPRIAMPGYVRAGVSAGEAAYASAPGNRIQRLGAGIQGYRGSVAAADMRGEVKLVSNELRGFGREVGGYARVLAKGAGDTARVLAMPIRNSISNNGIGTTAAGVLGGAKNLLGTMAPMLAITGVIAGASALNSQNDKREQDITDYANSDMYGTINAYREANGRAGVPVVPVSAGKATDTPPPAVTDPKVATTVTAEDMSAGQNSVDKKVHSYYGSPAQVAAQIKGTQLPGGMSTQDLVDLKNDLTRQPGATQSSVQATMDALGPQTGVTSTITPSGSNAEGVAAMVASAGQGAGENQGFWGDPGGWAGAGQKLLRPFGFDPFGVGERGGHHIETRSDKSIAATKDVGESIGKRFNEQKKEYKGQYASQEREKAMNAAMASAIKDGTPEQMAQLDSQFQTAIMGTEYAKSRNTQITADDIEQYGTYTKAWAAKDAAGYGKKGGDHDLTGAAGGTGEGTGGIPAALIPGATATALRAVGPGGGKPSSNEWLAKMYDLGATGATAKAMQASQTSPENIRLGEEAGRAFVDSGLSGKDNSGVAMSLTDVAVAARSLANALPDTAASARAAAAAMTQVGLAQANAALSQTPAQQRKVQFDTAFKNAKNYDVETKSGVQHTDAQSAANTTDRTTMTSVMADEETQMRAFLEAHRAYEKQVSRSNAAAGLAEKYAKADLGTALDRQQKAFDVQDTYTRKDYATNKTRAEHDFNLGRFNTIRDYNTSVTNMEADAGRARRNTIRDYNTSIENTEADASRTRFNTIRDYNTSIENTEADAARSRFNTIRDHNTSVRDMEADALRSRTLAYRDFGINLSRQIADSAKTMYDPYTRIQSKATWDSQNLIANMGDQTATMNKQKSQLAKLRKMGLSAQAIDQLQLGKTENAQQVGNLVDDFTTSPSQIAAMNKAAKARGAASGSLFQDDSNLELKRSKEDLERSLADNQKNLQISLKRSVRDLGVSLADAEKSLQIGLARSAKALGVGLADAEKSLQIGLARSAKALGVSLGDAEKTLQITLARSAKALGISLADNKKAFDLSQSRQLEDFNKGLSRAKAALDLNVGYMEADSQRGLDRARLAQQTNLGYMAQDVKDSQSSIQGNMTTLHAAVLKTLKGQTGAYGKLLNDDAAALAKDVGTQVVPKFLAEYNKLGLTAKDIATPAPKTSGKYQSGANMAEGGEVCGDSPHPKADNIPIMATAGEFMQPVSSVKHYGVQAMEAIQHKRIPKEALAGFANGGLIEFGHWLQSKKFRVGEHPMFGGVNPVHAPHSQHYNKAGPGGGGAIDVNHDQGPGTEKAAIDAIYKNAASYALRTLWQISGHFNHAHFDISNGPDMLGAGYTSAPRTHTNSTAYSQAGGVGGNATGAVSTIDIAKVFAGINAHHQVPGNIYGKLAANIERAAVAIIAPHLVGSGTLSGSGSSSIGSTGSSGPGVAAAQAYARGQLSRFGWGQEQMDPLTRLWNKESGWRWNASNGGGGPDSGRAYGIPQSLPGSKMAASGPDWRTNPATQINWGLNYIKGRPDYGSPDKAWAHSVAHNWYDQGGKLKPGQVGVNHSNDVEAVLTGEQWKGVTKLTTAVADLVTHEQSRTMTGCSGSHMTVNHHETITYDSRNDFSGAKISVTSADPDDMARKLEQRQTRQRLTAGRR
jgi:TP901 family phage tail tape measure protein